MTDEELIRQVAQEVMGWDEKRDNYRYSYGDEYITGNTWFYFNKKERVMRISDFNPFLNANHRDMVVERVRELGFNILLAWKFKNRINFCEIQRESYPVPFDTCYGEHKSIGHAVCEAAIAAIRSK